MNEQTPNENFDHSPEAAASSHEGETHTDSHLELDLGGYTPEPGEQDIIEAAEAERESEDS